jgi:hypothetical protein
VSSVLLVLKITQSWQTAESYELTVCVCQNGLSHTGALSLIPVRNISACRKTAVTGQWITTVITQIKKIRSYVASTNLRTNKHNVKGKYFVY